MKWESLDGKRSASDPDRQRRDKAVASVHSPGQRWLPGGQSVKFGGGALLLFIFLLTGCTAQQVRRIAFEDYGWCRDNGQCGSYEERYIEVLDCLEKKFDFDLTAMYPTLEGELDPNVPVPAVLHLDPASQTWWLGQCSWIACPNVTKSGLCKGWYRADDDHFTNARIMMPVEDDKSFDHEVCHHVHFYVYRDEAGDPAHLHEMWSTNCCFPTIFCR